jgi:hypothetical protein
MQGIYFEPWHRNLQRWHRCYKVEKHRTREPGERANGKKEPIAWEMIGYFQYVFAEVTSENSYS